MVRLACAAALVLLALGCRGRAPVASPVIDAPDPRVAASRLGDPSWPVRERATNDLLTMGEAALPTVREAASSPDAEVRWRARWLLSAIPAPVDGGERSGPLARSETWRGTVRIRGSVVVPAEVALSIEPGCRVVAAGDGCRLVVEGTLVAHGTGEAPIELLPEGASWEGIQVRGEGASASLRRCRIRAARMGAYCLRGRVVIEECEFADSTWGVYLNRPAGGVVRGCAFRGVATPIGLPEPCPGVLFEGNRADGHCPLAGR